MPQSWFTFTITLGALTAVSLSGCGRQPCGEEEGPRVRLDLALGTCNAAPRISIAGARLVPRRSPILLDASASIDPNGDELSFTWTLVSKPGTSLAEVPNPHAPRLSVVADQAGEYGLRLVVSDGELVVEEEVTVMAVNERPVAHAGSNQSVLVGAEVFLDGTASRDPNGDPLTHRWQMVSRPADSAAELLDASAVVARFTADVRGRYEVALEVSDGELSHSAMAVVAAGITITPPIAMARADRAQVMVGETVTLDGSGSSHPEGLPLTHRWRIAARPQNSVARFADPGAVRPSFVADAEGSYRIELVVSDGFAESAPAVVEVGAVRDPVGVGTFDPARVYLQGTLVPGRSGRDVICDLETPHSFSGGFPDYARGGFIRTDGVYVYREADTTLHAFVPESVRWDAEEERWIYPADPGRNDPVVPHPCPRLAGDIVAQPGTSRVVYRCSAEEWREQSGEPFLTCGGRGRNVLALGYDGSQLCLSLMVDATGAVHPISADESFWMGRARSEGGFWALRLRGGMPSQRWTIEPDGSARMDTEYSLPPEGYNVSLTRAVFDGEGRLYVSAHLFGGPDVVLRYDGPQVPVEVYNDRDVPCQAHISYLVTGP